MEHRNHKIVIAISVISRARQIDQSLPAVRRRKEADTRKIRSALHQVVCAVRNRIGKREIDDILPDTVIAESLFQIRYIQVGGFGDIFTVERRVYTDCMSYTHQKAGYLSAGGSDEEGCVEIAGNQVSVKRHQILSGVDIKLILPDHPVKSLFPYVHHRTAVHISPLAAISRSAVLGTFSQSRDAYIRTACRTHTRKQDIYPRRPTAKRSRHPQNTQRASPGCMHCPQPNRKARDR
mgnify:CR=1 FL=1